MGITPSNNIYSISSQKKFQFLTFLIGGSISLITLTIILILQLNKNEKGIISRTLKLITISEIINCIPKIINSFKSEREKFVPYSKTEVSNICYLQFIIQNFVDIVTPLLSLIIAREIFYLIEINELSFLGQNQKVTLTFSFLIPLIITSVIFLLQIFIFNNIDQGKIKNHDYVCYGSYYSTFIILIIILLLVSISIYYSIRSSITLYQKKKEFLDIEDELISNENNNNDDIEYEINEHPNSNKISAKLNKMYIKNLRYPILFSIIWLIFFFCRGYDIYDYKYNKISGSKSILIYSFIILNTIMSIRGLLYCFAFFSKSDLCSNKKPIVSNISLAEKNNNINDNEDNCLTNDKL